MLRSSWTVADAVPSEPLDVAALKSTVGVLSLSVIVIVAFASVRTAAPVTFDKLTVKFSFPSKVESSVMGIVKVFVVGVTVLPVAANVRVVLETAV